MTVMAVETQPQATADVNGMIKLTAYTQPEVYEWRRGSDTSPLSYPADTVVAFGYSDESGVRHIGREDVEAAGQVEINLPREMGHAVLRLMEENETLNCHGFANTVSGRGPSQNPASRIYAENATTTLAAGETGFMGSPTVALRSAERPEVELEPAGAALHSVIGLGHDSDQVINVNSLTEPISIVKIEHLKEFYKKALDDTPDAGLYRFTPLRQEPSKPVDFSGNPFDEPPTPAVTAPESEQHKDRATMLARIMARLGLKGDAVI